MSTIGDKIGLTGPTVSGSTDTWGTENNALWTLIDEVMYAAREDRNNVVMGGGKIAWDGSDVTFSASIEVINHITAYKNSITTAGSPVTLNAAGKVGYVQVTRKPGSNQNITSVTVVSSGSLPNGTADADFGTMVLFYRTADSTIMIPWARKELLSGDHWQFGAAQTWFERIASSHKPSYKTNTADTTQVVVPGSAAAPACVWIDGKLYANTSDATLDIDTAGRNGLDTGSKAAATPYYLYAIPATSGRTFDVVCSVTAPSGAGPTGFSSWSYIGAFCTDSGSSAISVIQASNGTVIGDNEIQSNSHTGGTTGNAETYSCLPTTAKMALGILQGAGTITDSLMRVHGANINDNNAGLVTVSVTSIETYVQTWVPIFTANTIYLEVDNASSTVFFDLTGWKEDPMEYK